MRLGAQGRVGVALLAVLIAASLGAALFGDGGRMIVAPGEGCYARGTACPLGCDPRQPNRSVCSFLLPGLSTSMKVGLVAGAASVLLALGLALVARRFGAAADVTVAKAADLVFAVPDVLVLIAIKTAVQVASQHRGEGWSDLWVLVGSLVAVGWAAPTRMIQNRLRSLEQQDFVLAAYAVGASRWRILRKHVLPVAADFVFAIFLTRVPAAILAESTVSFLGFGLPVDEASLGKYLGENAGMLVRPEGLALLGPSWALLALVVVAFHWTGQALLRRSEIAP